MTFKHRVKPLAAAIVLRARAHFLLDYEIGWSDLSYKQKKWAIDLLEKASKSLFPLKACLDHWGARHIKVKSWRKAKSEGKRCFDIVAVISHILC
ncbi:uncharacterized protein BYT42DRAFT_41982 [Radiomyces spectabilis]|uniref:uncharacterized protein n=1 Tax=Radiomyces spectabilis TaxID=64574 RepID=UPI00221F18FB|nr:uncharacterized protein BYT42DRAFT_41982 [Radiomyces spectabilis]KAI8372685.1 hypothetical protein BYT42DRAFT_41982 [Radiomyces spectabilis]